MEMQALFDVNLAIRTSFTLISNCFVSTESSILEGLAPLWDTNFLMALIIQVNITCFRNENFSY